MDSSGARHFDSLCTGAVSDFVENGLDFRWTRKHTMFSVPWPSSCFQLVLGRAFPLVRTNISNGPCDDNLAAMR
jgi:hypothetical protein